MFKSNLRQGTNPFRPRRRVQFASEALQSAIKRDRKTISRGDRAHLRKWAQFPCSIFWGWDPRRYLGKRKNGWRSCLEVCQKCVLAEGKNQTKRHSSHLLKCGAFLRHLLSNQRRQNLLWIPEPPWTSWTRRTWMRPNWKLSGLLAAHNSLYSEWWSAHERGSDGVRQRFGFIRDCTAPRKHTVSFFTWATLRRSWVYLWMDWRSKTTPHQKWHRFFQIIPWILAKPVEIYRGIIVLRLLTDLREMVLQNGQYAEWKKALQR